LRRLRRRGSVVVIDPRRTRTAEEASEYHPIRPGTDAHFLMAMVHVLFAEGLVNLGRAAGLVVGVDTVQALARSFAAVYGRIGTTTQEFGTLASWLVDVLNVLTGNLDRPGGAMFPKPAAGGVNTIGTPRYGRGVRLGRWESRVSGRPETLGELPLACLAEEIGTPGNGQVRAMITVAGNPARSAPNSARLEAALSSLDFMVSVDVYVNETTHHANVILPPPSQLCRSHYDIALLQVALRNVANYSPPVLPPESGQLAEWQILAKLALIAEGQGAAADPAQLDDAAAERMIQRAVTDERSPLYGRTVPDVLGELSPRVGPDRLLDVMLRTGPYRLSLDELCDHPHGLDLGPLEPRLPEVLRTPSGMIELAPQALVADVARLRATLERTDGTALVLIGRRHLRSNNSWMHNIDVLVKGKERCVLQVNPADASRVGLLDGGIARVTSRTGLVEVLVEVTDEVMPGVVSLPHGWGHHDSAVAMMVARAHPGVNSNYLSDDTLLDPVSGNAVLNGIPVTVAPVLT
jgi:anaerobic selenocysteine-containing dehydrogenase